MVFPVSAFLFTSILCESYRKIEVVYGTILLSLLKGIMQMFEIMTDSTANLTGDMIRDYHLHVLSLSFVVDGKEYKGYEKGKTMDLAPFYAMMREKKDIKTSLANSEDAYRMGKAILKQDIDLLYLGFSSGLSSTFQAVSAAFEELREEYPQRQVLAVDSLSAALGEGLFVKYVVDMRENGASIGEAYSWALRHRLNICHEFTVDDLFFLKRGGRISAATAVLGTALSVKPVLHVDDEGHLIPVGKTRGRKKSLDALVERMKNNAIEPEKQEVYISHGDCLEDAEYVAEKVRECMGVEKISIHVLDPVIGAHSGPGTVALFYYGEHR